MKPRFVQSGGLLGAVEGCEVDTATLALAAARDVQAPTPLVMPAAPSASAVVD